MKKRESIGYISGEPEGLGRREGEEFKEEEERLAGGNRQSQIRRKKEAIIKAEDRVVKFVGKAARALKKEISLEDAPDEDLISNELNPEQALELKEAIRRGDADIASKVYGEFEDRGPLTLEDLRKRTEEKERILRNRRRKK